MSVTIVNTICPNCHVRAAKDSQGRCTHCNVPAEPTAAQLSCRVGKKWTASDAIAALREAKQRLAMDP